MNREEQDVYYSDNDDDDDVQSVTSEITHYGGELEEDDKYSEDIPAQAIDSGDGEYRVFSISPWKTDGYGVITQTSYMNVYHSHNFRDYFTDKLSKLVLNKCDNYEGYNDRNKNAYCWNFEIYGCCEVDPNRWSISIPCSSRSQNVWENLRLCGNARVEVEHTGVHRGRCLVYIYVKSSPSGSFYQHYCGQFTHRLDDEEMRNLNVPSEDDVTV